MVFERKVTKFTTCCGEDMKCFHSLPSIVRIVRPGSRFFLYASAFVLFIAGWQVLCSPASADETNCDATFAGPAAGQKDYIEGEVLVLADDTGEDDNEIEAAVGGAIRQRITFISPRHSRRAHRQIRTTNKRVLRIKLPAGKSVEQAIAEARLTGIKVEPNYKLRITAIPNDPMFGSLWAMRNTGQAGGTEYADIDAVSAWDITTGSDDVIVAVIDTGIDYLHPDLIDNMWTNPGEIPGNGVDDDGNGYVDDVYGYDFVENDGDAMDEHSHGTHCAGTIGARGNNGIGVTGVNWRCKLMACRFLDASGSGSVADAIYAINYAVANGADILSNSWGGGGYSASLETAIINAKNNGVLFVAAAGNDAVDTDVSPHYPSGYNIANVIAVAATDRNDELASFSNYGSNSVHIAAPGVSILSSVLDDEYKWYSGTSMATPHVAGVAALLLAHDPTMSLYELKSRLIWTGDPIQSLADKTITGRRLNAYNALATQSGLTVLEPNSEVTWVQGFDWTIQWLSIGGSDTVDIFLLKPDGSTEQLADGAANTGTFSWRIPATVEAGSGYRIWIDDGVNADESDVNFIVSDTPADYFTELFNAYTGRFDLSNKSLLLMPDESASRYSACLRTITELPVYPGAGTTLALDDDDAELVTLTGQTVRLYGTSYSSFYVGSNGYITFGSPDVDYSESVSDHFRTKRVAGLFRDLDPAASGFVSVETLSDRAAVTWQDVPEYGSSTTNTFQIELFYDGRIRISWLAVAARSGLVGISEGAGVPVDFLSSDVSSYEQCLQVLDFVEIIGPDSVAENSSEQFTCIAHYEDGGTEDITASQASWSVDSGNAVIDENGLLATGDVSDYQQCTVSATFDDKSDSQTVIITDNATDIVAIERCTVRAGKAAGRDSIVCSGDFGATAELFAAAYNVTVRIYSSFDDTLIYEQTISPDLFSVKRNIYKYKSRTDGITLLQFDMNKNRFCLKTRNIDLTGLECPFYVLIDIGAYTGLGIADEDVINGRRSMPIQLLSEYADTLAVTKAKPKSSSKPLNDRLSIKGTFTVSDESTVTEGLTITWGSLIFTIPGSEFRQVKVPAEGARGQAGRLRCGYRTEDGAEIYADFNFPRCSFTIVIKKTTIVPKSGAVDFGMAFGSYGQTVRIRT